MELENIISTKINKVEIKETPTYRDASEYRDTNAPHPDMMDDDISGYVEIIDYKFQPRFKKSLIFNGKKYHCGKVCQNHPLESMKRITGHDENGNPKFSKVITEKLAKKILKEYDMIYVNETLYLYENGVYIGNKGKSNIARLIIEYEARNVMGVEFSEYKFKNVLSYIHTSKIKHQDDINNIEQWHLINFQNGIYNVLTRELLPHTPEHLSTIQLQCDYDPDASCPMITKFLDDMVALEYHMTLLQMLSKVLIPNKYNNEYLVLVGQAGTGKTQILYPIKAMLGTHYTSMGLNTLAENQYALGNLQYTRANICGDISTLPIKDTAILKQITGGETVDSDIKFSDRIQFRPTCVLIFSANKLPRIEGADTADMDRLVYVPYTNRIRGTDAQITNFDELITTPEELSGFVNLLLIYLEEYLKSRKIHRVLKDVELAEDYACKSAPESTFFDYCVRPVDESAGMSMSRQQAYDIYCAWCQFIAVTPKIPRALGNILSKRGIKGYNGRNMHTSTWIDVDISLPVDIIEKLIAKGQIAKSKYAYYSGFVDGKHHCTKYESNPLNFSFKDKVAQQQS